MEEKTKIWLEWYNDTRIQKLISKATYNRETAIISKLEYSNVYRFIRCHDTQTFSHIIKLLPRIKPIELFFNFYYSLASYQKGLPYQRLFSLRQHFPEWNEKHHKEMVGYDFVIDIDAPNHETIKYAHSDAVRIKKYFDNLNIPYQIRFSGKGFHFVIPYKYIDIRNFEPYIEGNVYEIYSRIARFISNKFTELIDLKIYDSRRVLKIPYSLACYEEGNCIKVCYPYSIHEVEKFINFNDNEYILFNQNCNNAYNVASTVNKIQPHNRIYTFNRAGNFFNLIEKIKWLSKE